MNIEKELFEMRDTAYKEFHSKLMPTINPDTIIGIRVPQLRRFASAFAKTEESRDFLQCLPHKYYEENNLHAFIIEHIKDCDTALNETERFLPYIDNWATCDMFLPKVFKKNTDKLLNSVYKWLKSDKTYTVRFAIGLLMRLYLDEKFDSDFPKLVAKIKSDEYYIQMMAAWYFATALSKQYDDILPYFTEKRLPKEVHNKAIQKAVESRRIDAETKKLLKKLK